MSKKIDPENAEALEQLRGWLKPGDTVYTILETVSRSGMSRTIRCVVPYLREDGTIDHIHPNYSIAKACGMRRATKGEGIVIGGCGMDMGFALVYELSHVLYGKGYACLGKGKCPSPYHSNHRDHVRCEGTTVYNPDGPNTGHRCYAPNRSLFGRDYPVRADWPRRVVALDNGEQVEAGYLSCLLDGREDDPSIPLTVCPTCAGAGELPNPDGPERFDLIHVDGYALRQRWL